MRLAGDAGQHKCPSGETKGNISLCRLGHPSNPQGVRTESLDRRQRGRIKFDAVKGSEARERDMTYLGYAHATQPPSHRSKCTCGVIRPRRRRRRSKMRPTYVNQAHEGVSTQSTTGTGQWAHILRVHGYSTCNQLPPVPVTHAVLRNFDAKVF